MDTDIRKNNKIPGCEQLTKPEEIAALSKYLGEIKKIQEEHTKLEKDNLGLPGAKDPNETIPLDKTRLDIENSKKDIELETERIGLDNKVDVELGSEKENIGGEVKEPKLETELEALRDTREITLTDHLEKLGKQENQPLETETVLLEGENGETELNEKLEKLEKTPESVKLSDYTDSLDIDDENELNTKIENLEDTREQNLSDFISELSDDNDVNLESLVVSPNIEEEELELEDHTETIDPSEVNNLDNTKKTINPEDVEGLSDVSYTDYLRAIIQDANARRDEDGLYELAIRLFGEDNSEWARRIASYTSAYLSGSTISPERADEYEQLLANSFIYPDSSLPNQNERPENRSEEEIETQRELNDSQDLVRRGGVNTENNIEDTRIGRPENVETRSSEDNNFRDPELTAQESFVLQTPENNNRRNLPRPRSLRIPAYKMDISNANPLNRGGASNYLRFLAENTVGKFVWGSLRAQLLNEALALLVSGRDKLEEATKTNRSRLPGSPNQNETLYKIGLSGLSSTGYGAFDLSSGIKSAVRGAKSLINKNNGITASIPDYPFNRPPSKKHKDKVTEYGYLATTRKFNDKFDRGSYVGGKGLNLTLRDLCKHALKDKDGKEKTIETLEDLQEVLKNSSLITTSNKIISPVESNKANGDIEKKQKMTLDSNMYWEVVLSPWCQSGWSDSSNSPGHNGGYSYLPSFEEINVINKVDHNFSTYYNDWIPISGFELQKSKITSKSLGLFDGEINYPISVEFTNELRITIIDDQYKSWKHYFQKCADVSVYSSEPHPSGYYDLKSPNVIPTAVDKNYLCAAFYKNITFLAKIYVMTPQYSTVRRFQLLCVLKDFSEDYSGEYESGGSDLSVNFSIVGEIDQDMDEIGIPSVMSDPYPIWLEKQRELTEWEKQDRLIKENPEQQPVIGGSQYSWK